jgi:uncharacterized protein
MAFANPPDHVVRELLTTSRTIAVVGCSPNPARPSHEVSAAMQQRGYRIVPVNPLGGVILGEKVFPDLASIPPEIAVDIVDVFRRSEETAAVAEQAVARGARALWLQQGVYDERAAAIAQRGGLLVIMDACLSVWERMLMGARAQPLV